MANHADLSRTHTGMTFALANTFATVPGLLTGPLTARLIEAGAGWSTVWGLAAAVNFSGAALYFFLAKTHRVVM
jgi:hypothetical protein